MRGGDSRHHALMPGVADSAIERQTRHTLNGHAFLPRELEHCFQTIDMCGLQDRDRLDLSFAGAQRFEHGVDAVDNISLLWTTWFSRFAIVWWAASRHLGECVRGEVIEQA